jgi:putative hydrolase of the HAD superfamily
MTELRINAIFFDLDGTLRFSDPNSIDTFHSLAAGLGLEWTNEQELEARRWIMEYWANSDELLQDLEIFGNYPENGHFWRNHSIKHLMQLGAGDQESGQLADLITEKMREEYQPEDQVPSETRRVLEGLKDKGYALGVVSNRQAPFSQLLVDLDLDQYFQLAIAAGEVGFWKPDPRLLLHAADQLDVDPRASIYVGDNYYADVRSAQRAKMHPVLLDEHDLFPMADCPVIHSMSELIRAIEAIEERLPA